MKKVKWQCNPRAVFHIVNKITGDTWACCSHSEDGIEKDMERLREKLMANKCVYGNPGECVPIKIA